MLQKTDLFYHHYLPEIKDEFAFKEYLNLIENALNRKNLTGYVERHHIVPRCYLPKDWKYKDTLTNNIVIFTAKEHFLAHFYIRESFKDDPSSVALMMLSNCKNHWHVNRNNYLKYSKLYEELRLEYSNIVSKNFKGCIYFYNKHTNKTIKVDEKDIQFYINSDDYIKGYPKSRTDKCRHSHSVETRQKISIASKNVWEKPGYKEKMSNLHKQIAKAPENFIGVTKNTTWMNNGTCDIRVNKNDENKVNELKNLGYVFGRSHSQTKGKIKDRIWVNNGVVSKIIKPEIINEYIASGFSLGRIYKRKV